MSKKPVAYSTLSYSKKKKALAQTAAEQKVTNTEEGISPVDKPLNLTFLRVLEGERCDEEMRIRSATAK